MRHFKDSRFQPLYDAMPVVRVRKQADNSFALLEQDPKHPSLHVKRIHGDLWSARVGRSYRALAVEASDGSNGSGLAAIPTMIG